MLEGFHKTTIETNGTTINLVYGGSGPPVLLLHGDGDQVVPIAAAAEIGVKLLKKGTLKVYPGGAHALPNMEAQTVNEDLLNFLKD